MPKISVIIVSYNVQYFLELCLQSVVAAAEKISTEIIVVDNNSSDASCSLIEKEFPQVKLITNKENSGFSIANNLGVEKAKGEFILILNPDTFIAEDTLINVVTFAERQKNFGALGVKMIDGTGNFLPESKRNVPTLRVAMKKLMGQPKDYYATSIRPEDNAEVEILTGAFLLIRREVYKSVGGFDEDYFMFGEDVDLCYKLLKEGNKNYYFGKETIVHFKGESTEKDKRYLKNFYGAMQIFFRKHYRKGWFTEQISELAVKMMILFRTTEKKKLSDQNTGFNTVYYFGEDQETFQKIKKSTSGAKFKMISSLPGDMHRRDCMIFDSSFLTSGEIISLLIRLKDKEISKRILTKDAGFYIGSDSPVSRGIAVIIRM